jgi:1,4-alpha-glucan branching enzyme
MKWDMGWMHDVLLYMQKDPVYRKYHHNNVTFRALYSFHENFVLPLSHDEVVHGKGSLLGKMPGDDWRKFANLRLLFGMMYSQPGKKLLFMGGEFGQWREWTHEESLDWHLVDQPGHRGLQLWIADLNHFYAAEPAMHELDFDPAGFEWVDAGDWESSVFSYMRKSRSSARTVLAVFNCTPIPRHAYRIGVPAEGRWVERLNSDAPAYGGSGQGNYGGVDAEPVAAHGRAYSVPLTLPPLGCVLLTSPDE